MDLSYAIFPVLGILAFAFAWNKMLDFLETTHPNWRKTPNYFSIALAIGITVFMTQVTGAFLLDPLAMDKVQVGILSSAFTASDGCRTMNYTPVLSLACQPPYLFEDYTGNYAGVGLVPYGEDAGCVCKWAMKDMVTKD